MKSNQSSNTKAAITLYFTYNLSGSTSEVQRGSVLFTQNNEVRLSDRGVYYLWWGEAFWTGKHHTRKLYDGTENRCRIYFMTLHAHILNDGECWYCWVSLWSALVKRKKINFGAYTNFSGYLFDEECDLNFNDKQPMIASNSSSTVTIALSDIEYQYIKIVADAERDITITVTSDTYLIIGAGGPGKQIPFACSFAYSNLGSAVVATAKSSAVEIPVGFTAITLPMLRRTAGVPLLLQRLHTVGIQLICNGISVSVWNVRACGQCEWRLLLWNDQCLRQLHNILMVEPWRINDCLSSPLMWLEFALIVMAMTPGCWARASTK